jgi:two-component system, sensor histidine kinase and response regulator
MSDEKKIFNILIVDDIPDNLRVLGGILKEEGYKIRPVLNGELALQVAEKEKPDLILLDIMMPGMDGYEVSRQLKANPVLKDIPVIFISALNDTADLVKAFESGGVDYITKPFQAAEVTVRVATHLKICLQNNELREVNATKDKFFSIIAHDLRGPIGNMLSISEVISEKGQVDEDTLYSFIEMQKELSKDTIQLLENLMIWARSNTNRIDFEPESLDLNTLFRECIEGVNIQAMNKNITISGSSVSPSQIFADENMIRLIIRNLLNNAIKFTPHGGSVSIYSTDSGLNKETLISVRDTGIGMPPEMLKNLFRIEVSNKRYGTDGEASNGMGLLLCKEFVEKHNGKIWVESEENKGSVFSFSIPAYVQKK